MTRRYGGLTNLVLPASDVDTTPLVSILVNAEWLEVLLSIASELEDTRIWEDGTDTDRALFQAYKVYDQIRKAEAPP